MERSRMHRCVLAPIAADQKTPCWRSCKFRFRPSATLRCLIPGGGGNRAFGVGLLQELLGHLLGAAGVVIGLLGFAVFVYGACTLAEQVEYLAEVEVAPDFGPLLGSFGDGLQRIAEGVGGGLIIFLIEESFPHAEVGQRAIRLNREGALVLADGVVVAALLGEFFTAGDGGAGAQRGATL